MWVPLSIAVRELAEDGGFFDDLMRSHLLAHAIAPNAYYLCYVRKTVFSIAIVTSLASLLRQSILFGPQQRAEKDGVNDQEMLPQTLSMAVAVVDGSFFQLIEIASLKRSGSPHLSG